MKSRSWAPIDVARDQERGPDHPPLGSRRAGPMIRGFEVPDFVSHLPGEWRPVGRWGDVALLQLKS